MMHTAHHFPSKTPLEMASTWNYCNFGAHLVQIHGPVFGSYPPKEELVYPKGIPVKYPCQPNLVPHVFVLVPHVFVIVPYKWLTQSPLWRPRLL